MKEMIAWRASGPIRAMLKNETSGGAKRTNAIEAAICAGLANKYPKLAARFHAERKAGK